MKGSREIKGSLGREKTFELEDDDIRQDSVKKEYVHLEEVEIEDLSIENADISVSLVIITSDVVTHNMKSKYFQKVVISKCKLLSFADKQTFPDFPPSAINIKY